MQDPRHAMYANRIRIKEFHEKRQSQARGSWRLRRQKVPQVCSEVSRVRTTTKGSFATEQIVLDTAPTTFNQRVTPSRAMRKHSEGDLTVRPRTQAMHGNGVPVHRVAVRVLAREHLEERDNHGSARAQPQQER
jgi:hypothetical protein